MFVRRLNAVADKLTASEKQIAEFIKSNSESAKSMTSYEMSQQLGIGQSTIIRFSQKLGYDSYRDMQVSIANENVDAVEIQDVSLNEDTRTTNYKIMKQYQDIICLTNSINSDADIDKTVEYLKNAPHVTVYGVGNSNLFAEYLANQLTKFGFNNIYCSTNSHLVYSSIASYAPGDVVFFVSETGETREILKSARLAKKSGATVISMTRMIKNSLYEYSDLVLKTVNYLSETRLEAMTMRCSQLCIIDMILLNLYKTDFSHYSKIIERSERLRIN